MEKVRYKTKQSYLDPGDTESITPCIQLKRTDVLVGTYECMACSYCYDVNRDKKYVVCRKILKTNN